MNTNTKSLKNLNFVVGLNNLSNIDMLLRGNLDLNREDTFGFEFEFSNANIYEISIEMEKYIEKGWELKPDGTVVTGSEITTPIMHDNFSTWFEISDVCAILNKYANIDECCGGHIHIGTHIFQNEYNFLNFVKTWIAFEDIIFRFSYGEYLYARENIYTYSMPISKSIITNNKILNLNLLSHLNNYTSLDAVHIKGDNFKNFSMNNTIEFRCPNGSLNPIIWQNNLNLFMKLIKYAKNSYNDNLIMSIINDNRLKYNQYYLADKDLIDEYSEVNIEKAIQMCNIIFDNDLDKVYFLKQYLKNFETEKVFKKAKKFTK